MSLDEIKALNVRGLTAPDAHLYLWTVNQFLVDAYDVASAWGFRPVKPLVWSKKPRGLGPGGTFANTTEFVLFCRRGSLAAKTKVDRTCWEWKRPYGATGIIGSAKPDGFYDLVESVSPGPYVELFARRARFGWDYWGDQSLGTVEVTA
jgi:N6-adenosine-specific RNA methylase IME4